MDLLNYFRWKWGSDISGGIPFIIYVALYTAMTVRQSTLIPFKGISIDISWPGPACSCPYLGFPALSPSRPNSRMWYLAIEILEI